eukprot:gene11735-15701_t
MGNQTSNQPTPVNQGRSLSISSTASLSRTKNLREQKRYGVVNMKISSTSTNRRGQENTINHVITPKGTILYGSLCTPFLIQKALSSSGYPILAPSEIALSDSRAHKLLITYCNGWNAIPFPEVFSRHSGTCLILGDRTMTSPPFSIKVGDCFRLGSVGLVVSEMRERTGCDEIRIENKTLQFLKDESLALEPQEDMAALASDEYRDSLQERQSTSGCSLRESAESMSSSLPAETFVGSGGIANGERYVCYMCYETHNTDEDALVAPCECKGDTRYLHVQCLQKWYQSSVCGVQAQVIRTTGNGAPACKICGAAYKTTFRRPDGKKASLLEIQNDGPYLSLVVVTKHDTNPGLFNTKFRLNFGRMASNAHLSDEEVNSIVIGRSSSCNMILDYRTVSTIHAKIHYSDGKFFLTDKRSSNGTMIYLQDPLPLPYSTPLRFRMGRTTLQLQAKRNWTSAMRSMIGNNYHDVNCPSAMDIMNLLNESNNSLQSSQNNPNFLSKRSYTLKTINEGSVDGGDNNSNIHAPMERMITEVVDFNRDANNDMNLNDYEFNEGGNNSPMFISRGNSGLTAMSLGAHTTTALGGSARLTLNHAALQQNETLLDNDHLLTAFNTMNVNDYTTSTAAIPLLAEDRTERLYNHEYEKAQVNGANGNGNGSGCNTPISREENYGYGSPLSANTKQSATSSLHQMSLKLPANTNIIAEEELQYKSTFLTRTSMNNSFNNNNNTIEDSKEDQIITKIDGISSQMIGKNSKQSSKAFKDYSSNLNGSLSDMSGDE